MSSSNSQWLGDRRAVCPTKLTECPEPEAILALFTGELDSATAESLKGHIDGCDICQIVESEAGRAATPLPNDTAFLEQEELPPETKRSETTTGCQLQEPSHRSPDSRATLNSGSLIGGRYRVRRFLARGGTSEIYEAYDLLLNEDIALKVLATGAFAPPEAIERLKEEVRLTRRVDSPHIARIFDFGEHRETLAEGKRYFLSMELVRGRALGGLLRERGKFKESEVGPLALQLLEGLCAAHRAGVLHRDFKSDNIMLRPASSNTAEPTAVILDFGLASALQQERNRVGPDTQVLLGSAAYVAPEQAAGLPLTESADLYSFGVVLFEMLTGSLPFGSSSAMSTVLLRLRRPAPKPSTLLPGLAKEWDRLLVGCLRRDPSKRYSGDQIRQELQAIARTSRTSSSRSARHRNPWSGFGLGCAVGATGMWFGLTPSATTIRASTKPPVHQTRTLLPAVSRKLDKAPAEPSRLENSKRAR